MERIDFEQLVNEAITELPEQFKTALTNIAIIIEDEPGPEHLKAAGISPYYGLLFGLYQGVPLTKRGGSLPHMPDRITIFQGPIERAQLSTEAIKNQVKSTVQHDIRHYFGLSEQDLRSLQKKK